LLSKLKVEQKALGGQVFNVLGKAIDRVQLRELLIEAILYGDLPETRAKLERVVSDRLDRRRLQDLLSEKALARDAMDVTKVQQIREEMERAEARKLQPHFITSFFIEAFRHLGGVIRQKEAKRYQITHVPAVIRSRGRQIGTREPLLTRYEQICFDKQLISVVDKPMAAFICPGHPLLEQSWLRQDIESQAMGYAIDYILALVEVPTSEEFAASDAWKVKERSHLPDKIEDDGSIVSYVKQPFQKEPDFGVTSVNYNLRELK
jgi:hypothetical protein